MQEPDLDALRMLVHIGETGSLTATSRAMSISQQAVSLRLRTLEATIGTQLVARGPRGSRLTAAGQLVAGWAQPVLAASGAFRDSVAALAATRDAKLTVAASLTIAEYLLPRWIAAFRARAGSAVPTVQLSAQNSAAVCAAVREGRANLGFIETPSPPSDLQSRTLARDTIEIVVDPSHPWADVASVPLTCIAQTPLVLREAGSGTRMALERAVAKTPARHLAAPAAVCETTLGVRSTVMAGTAPGALSALAVADDIRAGRLVRVSHSGERIVRPLTAVWLRQPLLPAAQELLAAAASPSLH